MFGSKREAPPSIIEREIFAKETWVKAFYKGNSLIPLANEGIDLIVLHTLFQDKNIDWCEFANSEFSPRQIKFLGDEMSEQHRRKDVNVSTEAKAGMFVAKPRTIGGDRLKELWESTTVSVLIILLQYIEDRNSVTKNPGELLARVEKFFNEYGKNKLKIDQLKKALDLIEPSLQLPPIKGLLINYREGFSSDSLSDRTKWPNVYLPQLQEMLLANLTEAFDGNLPENIRHFILRLGWRESFD